MERTKVVLAQTKSRSLRTTIPASFARTLGIEDGTTLDWDIKPNGDRFVLLVSVAAEQSGSQDRQEYRKGKGGEGR